MAEADEERWEVDEENMIINSVQLLQNIGDDQSSSATSYSASVTNSPQAETHPGSISDDAQHRRLSIDQLTEEAEADLANNNDPNNNASSGNDGQDQGNNYHQDQHEVHEQQQQQQMMATAVDGGPSQNQNSAFEFDFDEPTETETINSRLSFDVDDDDVDPFQAALDRDVQLILKLMPDKAQDEVRYMLESHQENPSRVQVVLNEFLEQSEEPMKAKARETSPIPVRNKVGNGLKAKNSKKKSSSASGAATPSSSSTAGPSSTPLMSSTAAATGTTNAPLLPGFDKNWADLTVQDEDEDVGLESLKDMSRRKRKQPLLDLNLEPEDHLMPYDKDETSSSGSGPSKRPKLDVMSALVDVQGSHLDPGPKSTSKGASRSSSGSSTPTTKQREDSRHKIQLSEDQLYGPFNFMDRKGAKKHKQKSHSSSSSGSPSFSTGNDIKFKALRKDLQMLIESKETRKDLKDHPTVVKKPPSLVDLSSDDTRSPPDIVDLSQDKEEIRELFQTLISMFPTTCSEYLEEQAEELAGKPTALDRFITEHLARNSQPPDYWQPRIETIKTEPEPVEVSETATASDSLIEPSSVLNLNQDDQGVNMTIGAMEVVTDPQPGTSSSSKSFPAAPRKPMTIDETIDLTGHMSPPPAPPTVGVAKEPIDPLAGNTAVPQPEPVAVVEETEEDKANKRLVTLESLFPEVDPEFLHQRAVEIGDNPQQMEQWIAESIENNSAKEFPSRSDYEKRQKNAQMQEKYSGQVTVQEILDMYEDPEAYFMDEKRPVSELYKKHSLNQLKKEFRQISVMIINKIFNAHNGLFVPCVRALKKYSGAKRKTKRPDHECPMPSEIDLNFLKELQYSRKEEDVKKFINDQKEEHDKLVAEAKKAGNLMECVCCFNDECLVEDMLPCGGGHLFCKDCVQRASEVAIGEGRTALECLGQCDEAFSLSVLQKALKVNTFSKWLSRIQIKEIEKADIEGLEQCPFCPFATIMDTLPEQNKLFVCQNPDCGKESCRLCKEFSHIPLRCEEVEKDAEVRKRTYIEKKMTEAMIRNCWKCHKPFVKADGCNKMTCDCGASMCYLCRQPVRDYKHFFGQGGVPTPGQTCPLWSDNNSIHERDVARGALEAKSEMDKENPEVKLKHDPAKGINLEQAAAAAPANAGARMNPHLIGVVPVDVPPGLEGILPDNQFERHRMIREQERIEAMIRGRGHGDIHRGGPGLFHFHAAAGAPPLPMGGPVPGPGVPVDNFNHPLNQHINDLNADVHGFMNRMGELLHLREVQRQRNRAIRRREQQVLDEFRVARPPGPAGPPAAAAPGAAPAPAPPPPGRPMGPIAPPNPNWGMLGNPNPVPVPPPVNGRPPGGGHGRNNPMPAHMVQPAPPLPPPPAAHGGRDNNIPPQAHHQRAFQPQRVPVQAMVNHPWAQPPQQQQQPDHQPHRRMRQLQRPVPHPPGPPPHHPPPLPRREVVQQGQQGQQAAQQQHGYHGLGPHWGPPRLPHNIRQGIPLPPNQPMGGPMGLPPGHQHQFQQQQPHPPPPGALPQPPPPPRPQRNDFDDLDLNLGDVPGLEFDF